MVFYFIYSHGLPYDQTTFLCCMFISLGLFYVLPPFNVSHMFNLNHLPFYLSQYLKLFLSFLTFVLFLLHQIKKKKKKQKRN